MFRNAFVHAFVSSADKQDAIQLRIAPRRFLREAFARRRQQYDRGFRIERTFRRGIAHGIAKQEFHRLKQRRGLQHHSFTAAKRPIIDRAMLVFREQTQILHVDFNQAGFASLANDAVLERPEKNSGKIVIRSKRMGAEIVSV